MSMSGRLSAVHELTAGDARVVLAPEEGGRIAQITVAGLDLLVADGQRRFDWGLFPMVPFAGRVGHGRFTFDGREHQLARTLGPHAIHGTLLDRAWEIEVGPAGGKGAGHEALLQAELGGNWPFEGTVAHRMSLAPDHLRLELEVAAAEPMPVTVGWHPWFRRVIGRGGPLELRFGAGAMYERSATGVPTGALRRPPPPGPWDDCFADLADPPVLVWPGALELTIEHGCSHLVVYDEPEHALCVEPQTGPPDAVNLGEAAVVRPGDPLRTWCSLRWR